MNITSSYKIILFCLLAVFSCISCKKDEETETKPYMEGEIKFDFPTYVRSGSVITTEASGIEKPSEVTYKWIAGSMFTDTIALPRLTVTTPDSLGVFYISAYAFADGYYAASTSRNFTTVDPSRNGSLKGLAVPQDTFTDPRDNTEYDIVTIGSLQWFAQNLGWDRAGVAYENSPVMNSVFGRLYSWNEATGGNAGEGLGGGPRGICPEGWSIPTREDWEDLATAMGYKEAGFDDRWEMLGDLLSAKATFNRDDIWPYSYNNLHSNTAGWNAIPVGCYASGQNLYSKSGSYAFYWSSYVDGDRAYYRYIYRDEDAMPSSFTQKDGWYASVRCVRLKP